MRSSKITRALVVLLALSAISFVIAGCGSDNNDGSKTGAGAPAGATGDAAGGAAVEAGKQRNPNDVAQEKKTFSQEPPPVQLQTDDQSGYVVKSPAAVVIHSNKELSALKKKLYSNGVAKQTIAPTDFKTRQVVAVQMPKQAPGVLMQVEDIHVQNGKIQITAVRLLPGKNCKTGKSTRPYNVVETRNMGNIADVIKVKNIRSSDC